MNAPTSQHNDSRSRKRPMFGRLAVAQLVLVSFSVLALATPAQAQLVDPPEWEAPFESVPAALNWGVPLSLSNLRVRDNANNIGFDLLRIDDTYGTAPHSIAAAPFSITPGQPPDEEALIVAADDGIYLAENASVFGYTALEAANRVIAATPADPRRVHLGKLLRIHYVP